MIGEKVVARKGSRHAWLAWMVIGACMAAGNFAMKEHHFLILSLAPFAIGFSMLMTRRDPLIIQFLHEGIEVLSPEFDFIPYQWIEAITTGHEEWRQFSIAVRHRNGSLNIPADMDTDSRELFRFLRRELPEKESIGPPPPLRTFMRTQDDQFGEDRVFAYRSLAGPRFERGLMGVFISASLFVVGIIWILIGSADRDYHEWTGGGFLTCLGGAIGFVVCLANRRSGSSVAGDGGIVIAPIGIAVQQGDLLGKMRWEEIGQIDLNRMNRSVEIQFVGGTLRLGDVYHRSLRLIYQRLLDFWEGPLDDRR